MPVVTKWGAKWEYGWFKGHFVVPKEAAGERLVFFAGSGPEGVVFVNGQVASAHDWGRPYVTLSRCAKAGDRYAILLETYAGHGPINCGSGPNPPERETVPEPGPTQQTVAESSFGVWCEDAYQLWLDVEVLLNLRNAIDENSLRVVEIDKALRRFAVVCDFERPWEERAKTFREARKGLQRALKCVNGSTAAQMFAFGHGHLDVAWLWPLAESERKVARTFSNQLALMDEYPDHKFLQSQPHLYRFCKTLYPELYARVKKAVKAGQFIAEGGMWVEADTNVAGGEALIRQFVHGMRFLRAEFGVRCEMLWLPDVFGYSGALPQILRGCGIRYFSTAKIYWNYNGGDPFPLETFIWEGIDGSEVVTHLLHGYGGDTHPAEVIGRWNRRPQKEISSAMFVFGHGDGGGGPTRDHVEMLLRQKDLEGGPRLKFAGPIEFFKDLEKRGVPDARYVGELYFQAHRGTYTSQARTKRGNRKAELALREAEFWGAAAVAMRKYEYPAAEMDEAWKQTLLCQFHDILPGSSIHRVYEEAEATHAKVIDLAGRVALEAIGALSKKGNRLVVLNSLNWTRKALVALPTGWTLAKTEAGDTLPSQKSGGQMLVEVDVPSCGWTTIQPGGIKKTADDGPAVRATKKFLENDLLRVEFDAYGEITSLFDKETGRDLAAGPCNQFRLYKDVPANFDAWDLESTYVDNPVALGEKAKIEVLAEGPLVATLRITRTLGRSVMSQEASLRRGSRRVDFTTSIDWQESHRLLKVAFTVGLHSSEAIHEIQFGHIRRPNHASRPFDADRFEVVNHKWTALAEENRGFAVLNDSKYGVNVIDGTIALTLLRSPLAPDMTADKGRQEFTYAFYAWNGSLADSGVVREGYDLNVPVLAVGGDAGEASLFSVDAPNIVIEAVKPAEDGTGDVIVRLYESKRMATRCTFRTTLPVQGASEADMLESVKAGLRVNDGAVALDFHPFEVKTLRLA
jgi:alpha-mannosidase